MEYNKHIFSTPPLRLRMTRSQPCTYIHGKIEQRLSTDISTRPEDHDRLAETGFRRIENWVYKPACPQCQECLPFRVICADFKPSRNHKRLIKKNADVKRTIHEGPLSHSHYNMFQKYLTTRHKDGQMTNMSKDDLSSMIFNSPIESCLLNYHDQEQTLLSSLLLDKQRDGLSAVYSFFDPEITTRSIGHFMILDLINIVKNIQLDYLYLGYYVSHSQKMAYKSQFKPFQIYSEGRWQTSPNYQN